MSCYKPNYIVKQKVDSFTYIEFKTNKKYAEQRGWKANGKVPNEIFQFVCHDTLKYKDYFKEFEQVKPNSSYKLETVPCGCCIGCRLDYSRDWATRCMLEAQDWKNNYFITLTYDDDHLPVGKLCNNTLVKEDLTKFIKDLRKYYKYHFDIDNIRYFRCGEYGDMSFRPHYHLIAFNLPIPDLTNNFHYVDDEGHESITQHCKNGVIYYYSEIISKIWNKGNILIGECSYQSCAYVARYVVKKQKGKSSDVYKALAVEEPFVRMSRMPGLAQRYYHNNADEIINEDKIYLAQQDGCKIVKPPRYFDKQTELYNEVAYYINKEYRQKRSQEQLNTIYNQTNLHYDEYLEVLENLKELQIRKLQRKI